MGVPSTAEGNGFGETKFIFVSRVPPTACPPTRCLSAHPLPSINKQASARLRARTPDLGTKQASGWSAYLVGRSASSLTSLVEAARLSHHLAPTQPLHNLHYNVGTLHVTRKHATQPPATPIASFGAGIIRPGGYCAVERAAARGGMSLWLPGVGTSADAALRRRGEEPAEAGV